MDPAPTRSRTPALTWVLLVAVALTLLTTRTWQLDVDPPSHIIKGYAGQAHYRDEAAKAHESRNKVLFGEFHLSDADEYAFWRAQSPAWVWGQVGWFSAFGVGTVQARWFVVAHTFVALALLAWLVAVRRGWPAGIAALAMLGLNWAYLVYSRLALMEGALICWLLVATVGLAQLQRRPAQAGRWSLVAVLGLALACGVKQTALLLVPVFVVAIAWLGLRASANATTWRERLRAGQARRTLVVLACFVVALAVFVTRPEYQDRLAFNADHFTQAHDQSVFARAATVIVRGVLGSRLWLMFSRLAPVLLPLAVVETARLAWATWRRRRDPASGQLGLRAPGDFVDLAMVAWLVLALLANLASPHRAIRFQLIVLPPAAVLAGSLFGHLWQHPFSGRARRGLARAALCLVIAGAGVRSLLAFASWTSSAGRTATTVGAELSAVIGPGDAVVVGEFAAQAVFETEYRHFYVRPREFNDDRATLEALGITHVVFNEHRDFTRRTIREKAPRLVNGKRKLGVVHFRGRRLIVSKLRPRRPPGG